ncbi:hypothetical protein [Brevibacillus formosus]|uniref:hypothetical protein n=1 Tax=Brevibacillus formosus TaxID=54913 RepID=UPI001F435CA2|nr:hypothetical protein [Brevibacillus formosus]
MLKIAPYASEGTNLLQGDNERGQKGTPLTVKDLARIADCSYPTARKIVKTFIELHIMRRTGRTVSSSYQPTVFSQYGKTAEAWLLHLFSKEITVGRRRPKFGLGGRQKPTGSQSIRL